MTASHISTISVFSPRSKGVSDPATRNRIIRLSSGGRRAIENRILLENYFLPSDLERQIDAFVTHYNHR